MDRVALGRVFLQVPQFSNVSVILIMLHAHFDIYIGVTRRANGRSLGICQFKCSFRNRAAWDRKVLSVFTHIWLWTLLVPSLVWTLLLALPVMDTAPGPPCYGHCSWRSLFWTLLLALPVHRLLLGAVPVINFDHSY